MHNTLMRTRQVGKQELATAKARLRIGDNVYNHLKYIVTYVLYDKFDFGFKKVSNFYGKLESLDSAWRDDNNEKVTTERLYNYTYQKGYDVVAFIRSIPFSQKLTLADVKGNKVPLGANKDVDYGFLTMLILAIPVLKESYRFNQNNIKEFMYWIAYFVESYTKKQPKTNITYLCDDDIWQMFIDEAHWDIRKGEKVA